MIREAIRQILLKLRIIELPDAVVYGIFGIAIHHGISHVFQANRGALRAVEEINQ